MSDKLKPVVPPQSGGGLDTTIPTIWTAGTYDVTVGSVQFGTSPVEVSFSSDLQDSGIFVRGVVDMGPGTIFATDLVMVDSGETSNLQFITGLAEKPVGASPPNILIDMTYGYVPGTGDKSLSINGGNIATGTESGIPYVNLNTAKIKALSLPTYTDDASAGAGGIVAGQFYKTATGELRIKL